MCPLILGLMINGFLHEDGHFISGIRVTSMRQSITLRCCFTESVFASQEKREISGHCVFDEQQYCFVLEIKYSPGAVVKTCHTHTPTPTATKKSPPCKRCAGPWFIVWELSARLCHFVSFPVAKCLRLSCLNANSYQLKEENRDWSKNRNSKLLSVSLGLNKKKYSPFFVKTVSMTFSDLSWNPNCLSQLTSNYKTKISRTSVLFAYAQLLRANCSLRNAHTLIWVKIKFFCFANYYYFICEICLVCCHFQYMLTACRLRLLCAVSCLVCTLCTVQCSRTNVKYFAYNYIITTSHTA